MIIFVKLVLAHLLGDFIFQSNSWVARKEADKHKSIYLYLHILLHGALAWILVGKLDFGYFALLLALSHGIIDLLKLHFQKQETRRIWFVADQILHLIVLAVISLIYSETNLQNYIFDNRFWLVATGIILMTTPSSIVIKTIISVWTPNEGTNSDADLQNAGKYIGILERLFVFGFIITGHFEAIGFLLAAKSIFRFGDLTHSSDRKLTEYVLIGTLISFGMATLTGLLVQYGLTHLL